MIFLWRLVRDFLQILDFVRFEVITREDIVIVDVCGGVGDNGFLDSVYSIVECLDFSSKKSVFSIKRKVVVVELKYSV